MILFALIAVVAAIAFLPKVVGAQKFPYRYSIPLAAAVFLTVAGVGLWIIATDNQ